MTDVSVQRVRRRLLSLTKAWWQWRRVHATRNARWLSCSTIKLIQPTYTIR